jgi:hypothetical protein
MSGSAKSCLLCPGLWPPAFVIGLVATLRLTVSPIFFQGHSAGTISACLTDSSKGTVAYSRFTAILVERCATSNAYGSYDFPTLQLGTSTSVRGEFQGPTQTSMVRSVSQNVRLCMLLKLESKTEAVALTARAPLAETRTMTTSRLVNEVSMVEIPLEGRKVISLPSILPVSIVLSLSNKKFRALSMARQWTTMAGGLICSTPRGLTSLIPMRKTGISSASSNAVRVFRILTYNFVAQRDSTPAPRSLTFRSHTAPLFTWTIGSSYFLIPESKVKSFVGFTLDNVTSSLSSIWSIKTQRSVSS